MDTIVGRKYRLSETIGTGAYGIVAKGENICTNDKVAIKIERISSSSNMLKNESKIYLLLNKEEQDGGFPTLKWFGKDSDFYYMAMELLGMSLTTFKLSGLSLVPLSSVPLSSVPLSLVIKIGAQILHRIKIIHSKGLIHRDIKPDNLLFGIGRNSHVVHLIDFGFCKSFWKTQYPKEHISEKRSSSIVGTPNFVSVHAHNGISSSRRDDVESAIYVLIYLFLPLKKWNSLFAPNLSNEEVKHVKLLFRGSDDIPEELQNALRICDGFAYEDEPDYALI